MSKIAFSLNEISKKFQRKIDWILRVDGHTDKIPINNDKFNSKLASFKLKSNKYCKIFINEGIEPHRLVVAGFGENYPIDDGESLSSLQKEQKNRNQINYEMILINPFLLVFFFYFPKNT